MIRAALIIILIGPATSMAMPCMAFLTRGSEQFAKLEQLLSHPDASKHPLSFATPTGRELSHLFAKLSPTDSHSRHQMISSSFGSGVSHENVLTGANIDFAFKFLRYLSVRGILTKKSADGEFLLILALLSAGEPPTAIPSFQSLRTEVETIVNAEIPFRVDFTMPEVRALVALLNHRMPVSPDARATKVANAYGADFAIEVNYEGSNASFSHELIVQLSIRGMLPQRDAEGVPLLFRLLE